MKKSQFDSILEGQRKMMDWWAETSTKMLDTFTEGTEKVYAGSESMKDWYQRQQSIFEEASTVNDPKTAFDKVPEQYQKWIELQFEFMENWAKVYREGLKKMGIPMPEMNGSAPEKMMQKNWKFWNDKVQENSDWLKKNILDKLPTSMQGHYQNFNEIYDDVLKYWDAFQRMIQFGVYEKKAIENFFSPEIYRSIVNKLMGFKPANNFDESLNQVNLFFEESFKFLEQFAPNLKNWENQWTDYFKQFSQNGPNPFYQAAMDINHSLQENTEPFINLFGHSEPGRYAKILKDIQFAYTAFLVRNSEMQQRVYEAAQHALPKTIQTYHDEYRSSKEMPAFESFFNSWINNLEEHLTTILQSKDYSLLQSEVSKLGISVKGKLDELIELSFEQTPFLMKSHGDDLAREIHSLRRKVRDLEKKVKAAETPKTSKPAAKTRSTRAKTTAK